MFVARSPQGAGKLWKYVPYFVENIPLSGDFFVPLKGRTRIGVLQLYRASKSTSTWIWCSNSNVPLLAVDHRVIFVLPEKFSLTRDDECSLDADEYFHIEFRVSDNAVLNLCLSSEEYAYRDRHYELKRRNNTHSTSAAAASASEPDVRGARKERTNDDGLGTLLVSDGNRIFIRFSTEKPRRLYTALQKERPHLLPLKLHYRTGTRALSHIGY